MPFCLAPPRIESEYLNIPTETQLRGVGPGLHRRVFAQGSISLGMTSERAAPRTSSATHLPRKSRSTMTPAAAGWSSTSAASATMLALIEAIRQGMDPVRSDDRFRMGSTASISRTPRLRRWPAHRNRCDHATPRRQCSPPQSPCQSVAASPSSPSRAGATMKSCRGTAILWRRSASCWKTSTSSHPKCWRGVSSITRISFSARSRSWSSAGQKGRSIPNTATSWRCCSRRSSMRWAA